MMEFTLEKLKTCIVQTAILLFTDFYYKKTFEQLHKKVYGVSKF